MHEKRVYGHSCKVTGQASKNVLGAPARLAH